MPSLIVVSAILAAVLSAAGFYAGSRHCRWAAWRGSFMSMVSGATIPAKLVR